MEGIFNIKNLYIFHIHTPLRIVSALNLIRIEEELQIVLFQHLIYISF